MNDWRWRVAAAGLAALMLAGGAWWLTRETCRLSLAAHTGPAKAVALSPDGTVLASGGADGLVALWQLPTGRRLTSLAAHKAPITAVALSAEVVAAGTQDGILKLCNVSDGGERYALKAHKDGVTALVFAADGKTLYSAGADKLIRVWDVAAGKEQTRLAGHTGKVLALALSPDGQTLASAGGGDNAVRLWRLPAPQPVRVLAGHTTRVTALAFAREGRSVVSSDRDGQLRAWDTNSGQPETVGSVKLGRVIGLALAGDEALAASEDAGLLRWNLGASDRPKRWPHRAPVNALAVQGTMAVTAASDGRVRLWDVR